MAVLMGLSGSAVWFSRDYWLPAQSPSDPTGVAKTSEACALRPSVQKIDLGLVQQRTQKNLTFTLTNSGPTEINVSTIRTSCDCLSVEVGARSIQSGDTIEVTLFLDLGKEPNFAGALAIEVEGFQMSGQKLFGLTVLVSVKGEGRAGMPVPVDG
jgi:hypothetical protein